MLDHMDLQKLESKFGDSNHIRDFQGGTQQPCDRPNLFNQLHKMKQSPMKPDDRPTGSGGLETNNFNFKGLYETSPGKDTKREDKPRGFDDDQTTKGGNKSKSIVLSYVDEVKSISEHAMPPKPKRVLDSSEGQILISDPDVQGITGSSLLNGPIQAEYTQQKYLPDDGQLQEQGELDEEGHSAWRLANNNHQNKSIIEMIDGDRPLTPSISGDVSRVLTPIELKIVGKESSDGKDKNDAGGQEQIDNGNFPGVSIKNLDKKDIKDGHEDNWGNSG